MEETRALLRLLEAADLIGMVEELSAHPRGELSPIARAGLRVTLKNVRESILASHDSLAQGLCHKTAEPPRPTQSTEAPNTPRFERRDLRATIEKFIEPDE
ncbi:MAG: hypothetical protein RL417_2371 [Pseudomonadota bacterium]|jgi:hypothetical protein